MQKASERIRYYNNANGPTIGVVEQSVIERDGLYFRDIDGSGELTVDKDWRYTPRQRAEALAKRLTPKEKLGLIFVNQLQMGIFQQDKSLTDETGILDEKVTEKGATIFASERMAGTTEVIIEKFVRHIILRTNPSPDQLADWVNQLNALAEKCAHFVPVTIVSNSRNEQGELVFGMNDAAGVFAEYPGTMGIAAAVKGTGDMSIIDKFADCIRREWDAVGMKKGYMYMADAVTDPRWQRTYGTFGEDAELISKIFERLIPGIQGSADGVTTDGVAMTVKHFPGGGARENGFDPHYKQGQWNVYQTEGSLQKYHLPPFKTAVRLKSSSIMPYYAKPSVDKSAVQLDETGAAIPMQPVGFAYNDFFINTLLRGQLNYDGYINSDSGIVQRMCWGVEELDIPERIALAINNGVDIISGTMDTDAAREAYGRARTDYYADHPLKTGYTAAQLTLNEDALDRAVINTLTEQFALGSFENPYRDPEAAATSVKNRADWDYAAQVHRQSVVLLKNTGSVLPAAAQGTVYARCFAVDEEKARPATEKLRAALTNAGCRLTDDPEKADCAVLYVNPSSGNYFRATQGYLELDICENKLVPNVDDDGRPIAESHAETTLTGVAELKRIADTVRAHGGNVVGILNIKLAWLPGNLESVCDALLAGFDTSFDAYVDVLTGKFAPTGVLSITLPRGDDVIRVNENGRCVSPNDVPGFDKDKYMPDSLKDENGKAYAYRDSDGNYYEYGFGLKY